MTTTTRTARPTRRAPQWRRSAAWQLGVYAYLMAWAWAIALVVVVAVLAIVSRSVDVEMSAVAFSHHAFLWFPFSIAIMVTTSLLTTHVAAGMTRASFIKGAIIAAVTTGVGNAVVATTLLVTERWVYDRLGWVHGSGDVGRTVLQDGALRYGAGLALLFSAGMLSGLLVGICFYRLGGLGGILALPLALSPILLTGWVGMPSDDQWTAWGNAPGSMPSHPLLGVLVLAAAAAAYHLLVRRVPIAKKEG